MSSDRRRGALVAARVIAGLIFFAEGYLKITGKFVHGGFARSAAGMAKNGFPFWRPFLQSVVLPHPAPFGWAVGLGELALGLSLLFGFLVRISCTLGIVLMLLIGFGASYPEAGSSWARYASDWLTQGAYIALFLLLAVYDAGKVAGLDARLWRRRPRGGLRGLE
jgi:uncharacterized membrane protein YphA (DoxX/SURF4 family)